MISATNIIGKGVRFTKQDSVFITRGLATAVGGVYMLAEDADIVGDTAQDDANVTVENGGGDNGTRANTVALSANALTGLGNAAAVECACFILAFEAAADGQPYRGAVEIYYADAIVTTSATRLPRCALFPTANEDLSEARTAIGSPCIGRLLQEAPAATTLRKVHFRGFPGGFGNGPGTT